MRALLHVHSSYSYDGVPSLEELASWGESRGIDCIFLSEHTNDFDDGKMRRLVEHCDALAHRACRLVPGLEFPVRGGFHILGFAVRRFEEVVEPADTVRFIRRNDGIAVLAHPVRYGGSWPDEETMSLLHGIEAWSARYDGRFLPSGRVLADCRRHRSRTQGGILFGGQDLHEVGGNRLVVTNLRNARSPAEAIQALRDGAGSFGAFPWRLPSRGKMSSATIGCARALHRLYRFVKKVRDRASTARRGNGSSARSS